MQRGLQDDAATLDQLETRSMTSCTTATNPAKPARDDPAVVSATVFSTYRVKSFTYDDKLPITSCRAKVLETIENNQATIIRGATGSGKTTQVPQYILEHYARTGKPCNIVVTQPRRIAAISVAKRVCQERGWPLGSLCGYQVGMDKRASDDTRLSYVTTGVLLQKLICSKDMNIYTHVILDEVHERDQDTDLVLLIVRKLMRSNSRSTKVVLMSATFDCDLFANYFASLVDNSLEPAPVMSVEGRVYDVQEYYLEDITSDTQLLSVKQFDGAEPRVNPEAEKLAVRLIGKFDQVEAEDDGSSRGKRGTVLVFLPGLAEIQSLEACLDESIKSSHRLRIIPLHSTITIDEQSQAFEPAPPGMRKVILSTNIAESSVTVPDIKYVIDFCLTKNLVCDPETNYTSLKLEWASKANCTQRKGRAGRVSAGRVFRLVTRHFYQGTLQQYSVPEMLRCPLEMLVLHVKLLDLGEPKAILALALSPPKLSDLERSILFLKEVGALSSPAGVTQNPHDGRLTFVGRVLAHLPVDVRLGKLIVFGHVFGLLEECLVLAASLSARTVFARPHLRHLDAYDEKMQWAAGSASDCIAALNAYREWDRLRKSGYFHTSRNRETTWCQQKLLQKQRLYEVADVVRELEGRLKDFNIHPLQLPPHARRQREPQHDLLLLKVVVSAAFYPNYFLCGNNDEKILDRSMSGKNYFTTVLLKNVPLNQGVLYAKDIERLMAPCCKEVRISFEESRAYVEFPKLAASLNTVVHPAVYLAVKMRQLKLPLVLTLWDVEEGRARMQKVFEMQTEELTRANKLRTHRLCTAPDFEASSAASSGDQAELKQVTLPDPNVAEISVVVTHVRTAESIARVAYGELRHTFTLLSPQVVDCGHFWAHYGDDDTLLSMSTLQQTIAEVVGSAKALPATEFKKGTLCLAPFCDDVGDEQYYRARIQLVNHIGQHGKVEMEVFFVDYGNTSSVDASMLKCFPPEVTHLTFQAVEYQLAGIKPSLLKSDCSTQWAAGAKRLFHEMVYGKSSLIAQIYSIVSGIVRIDLVEKHPSGRVLCHINQSLVDRCLADRANESFVSEQNHKFREEQRKAVVVGRSSDHVNGHWQGGVVSSGDFMKVKVNMDLNVPRKGPEVSLGGPNSPLEMSFYSMTFVGRMRSVAVDRESVNSVALNSEPQDRHERLMVAATVTINPSGTLMQARNTTLMPNIHGLPALLAILFAPSVELRTDPYKQRYTGALCGLGLDAESKCAALPDHDMEITFDTKFDLDDVVKINAVRLAVNVALGSDDGFIPLSDDMVVKIQDNARKKILELLEKRRESVEPRPFEHAYRWNMVNPDDLLQLNAELSTDGGSEQLLNLIQGIHLGSSRGNGRSEDEAAAAAADAAVEEEARYRAYLREHSKWLWKKAENRSSEREDILCELCNKVCRSTKELSAHLSTRTHKEEEVLLY